jgi:1,4-dihydroxy-2-naphthoyl-CoA hydrolase
MFRFDRDELKRSVNHGYARERAIRFQDVDAAGIIFFARAFELCHDLYVEFLNDAGLPLHESLQGPIIAPVRHAESDYLRPLRFGDRVEVALVAAQLGPAAPATEATFGFRISKLPAREPSILVQTIHTFVTRDRFERTEVPAAIVRALSAAGLLKNA